MKTRAVMTAALIVYLLMVAVWAAQRSKPEPAQSQWTEPYGGCKEAADYPGSPGYIDCVEHGWNPPAR